MALIGRAIAHLANRAGGQLMLELPDDLPPTFVAEVLNGANSEIRASPEYAWFVYGQRKDVALIEPRVGFRELGLYRQGARLAVAFVSDIRALSTFTTVYPLLLSTGFPAITSVSGGTGVASLRDFSESLIEVLKRDVGTFGLEPQEFGNAIQGILEFLVAAYEVSGNGQASFSADWWLHVHDWVRELASSECPKERSGIQWIYGCAGLPFPAQGPWLTMSSKEYVTVLQERWSNATAIISELGRLQGIDTASEAAKTLSLIDWSKSHVVTSLRSDSIVSRVALANGIESENRNIGWSGLSESDFKDSYIEAKGKLGIRRHGADLPFPWKGALPILVVSGTERSLNDAEDLQFEDIEIVIPFKPEANHSNVSVDVSRIATEIKIQGTRGCTAWLEIESHEFLHDGLHVTGILTLQLSRKAPNLAWLEVIATGETASAVVDRCSGSFTVLRHSEVGLWAKPATRATKSFLRGPVIWSQHKVAAASIDVFGAGAYEIAVACGESAGLDLDDVLVGVTRLELPWFELDGSGAKVSVEIVGALDVVAQDQSLFRIEVSSEVARPASPIVAAAYGLLPDASISLEGGILRDFEQMFGECLAGLEAGHALGCVLVPTANLQSELVAAGHGIYCTAEIGNRVSELQPGLPDSALLNLPSYINLLHAYQQLGIPASLDAVEKAEGVTGLTISRIHLHLLPAQAIENLLEAYDRLLAESVLLSSTNRFWARNPFSVVVFPDGTGLESAQAVLLSPLHPIRLVWSWKLQIGLREACEDGASSTESLSLLDGTNFPASCVIDDEFGKPLPLIPISIDPHPKDVYLGWHASVALVGGRLAIPESVRGLRFPVDGLSALSSSSVVAAINDFLRVSPHVQSIKLDLGAVSKVRRSSAIDEGILSKIRDLALGSVNFDGVAGVRVVDSTNRQGPAPRFSAIEDAIALARSGFNVEWTRISPNEVRDSHISFVEGSTAKLTMTSIPGPHHGWLPSLPLRRTPHRLRHANHMTLDFTLSAANGVSSSFAKILARYEQRSDGSSYALTIIPNLAGITAKPNWLVAADVGVDPQSLSKAAKAQANSDYILWDWRPVSSIRSSGSTSCRTQPYFVIASIPRALSAAINVRLKRLNSALDQTAIEARAKRIVSVLAESAIGLNTLLAIGHHQATGALGFYFSLCSLRTWVTESQDGEVRLVIPVDAVDPFLRASLTSSSDSNRQRADLLGVRISTLKDNPIRVIFVPIEVKHYGLEKREDEPAFPRAGEARLGQHVQQLENYQRQLKDLCENYRDTAGSQGSLLGQRLASILDAAIQLSPVEVRNAPSLLSGVANGNAIVELGKGILLWYQAGASGLGGSKASWDEVSGVAETQRIEVRIDPAAFDACFWENGDGLAHSVVREALQNATLLEDPVASAPVSNRIPDTSGQSFDTEEKGKSSSSFKDTSGIGGAGSGGAQRERDVTSTSTSHDSGTEAPVVLNSRNKLSEAELEKRYASLLAALGEFNVKVERPRGQEPYKEGPAFIEYSVSPAYGVSVNRIEGQLENLKLRLKLPSEATIGCSTHMGNVLLTIPKPDHERYFVDALELWSRWKRPNSGFRIPVGEDVSGNIAEVDLANSNSPHLLIAGVTGSGKSEALLTLLHGAARYYSSDELRFHLIDPKQTELNSLAELPHTDGPIGWTGEEAIVLLQQAVEEMEHRYIAFRSSGSGIRNIADYQASIGPMARWVVVLDEYADLISDDVERKEIEKCLQRLSQKARAAGIHIIVSTQKPVVKVVNTVVKGNLPGKIALRVNTMTESRVILDEGGAELLVGKGDAIMKMGNGNIRVQFARYKIDADSGAVYH